MPQPGTGTPRRYRAGLGRSRPRAGGSERSPRRREETTTAEWAFAGACALLVCATLGVLLHQALFGSTSPPEIALEVVAVEKAADGYLVEIQATNSGGRTAARLRVEGTLRTGEGVETSVAVLRHVPPHTSRRAGLFFLSDPRGYPLRVRPAGYDEP